MKAINREIDEEKIKNKLRRLADSKNYALHTDIIAGLPKQKYSDVLDDVRKLIELGSTEIQLEILKILPGTPISTKKNDISCSPFLPYEVLCTPEISFEELNSVKILSRIIDCYYNVSSLKSLFRFAVLKDNNFLPEFTHKNRQLFMSKDKPSLTARLNALFEYAHGKNDMRLDGMAIFASVINGCFLERSKTLKLLKKNELENIKNLFDAELLWENGEKAAEKPVYLVQTDFNAGSLFVEPQANIEAGNFQYLFYYSVSGISGKASKVEQLRAHKPVRGRNHTYTQSPGELGGYQVEIGR